MSIIIFGILALILFLMGFLGLIIPLVPGLPLAWLGYALYAWVGNFQKISLLNVVIFFILIALLSIFDFIAPIIGAKKYRASKFGIIGASLGIIIGIFLMGPAGIIFGPFLGAFLGELINGKKLAAAIKPAFGTFIGFMLGLLLKTAAIFIMFGFFIASLIK